MIEVMKFVLAIYLSWNGVGSPDSGNSSMWGRFDVYR